MHTLRTACCLARLLLACFALSLGVAMASPLVHAQGLERVCTASGEVRWVASGGNDAASRGMQEHALDCVLCLPPMLAPGMPQAPATPQDGPAGRAAPLVHQAHVPPLSRAPFPPRAPPALQAVNTPHRQRQG